MTNLKHSYQTRSGEWLAVREENELMHSFVNKNRWTYSFRDVEVVLGYRNKLFLLFLLIYDKTNSLLEIFRKCFQIYHLVAVLMKFLQDCALGYKVKTWLLKLEVEISYIFHLELPLYYILNLICYYNMNETFKPFLNATFSIVPPLLKPITSNLIYICAFNKKDSKRHSDSDASAPVLPFRSTESWRFVLTIMFSTDWINISRLNTTQL